MSHFEQTGIARRQFLYGLGSSVGAVALSSMLQASPAPGAAARLPARAKACIFLCMEGGPSQMDTFDPKPKLNAMHLKSFTEDNENLALARRGNRRMIGSPFRFRPVGQSGIQMCEHFEHLADVADDLCIYHGCQADAVDHPSALYHLNTGNRFGGDPAIGSWVNYGLGSENENLPGYIVLSELAFPQGGSGNWSNGFLPAAYQGTPLRASGTPILDLSPPAWKTRRHQRKNLDLLNQMNRRHQHQHPGHDDLDARIENYELAFRMQAEVPGLLDLGQESQQTLSAYGLDNPKTESFGRRCLYARRMIEMGVRFVQVFSGGWDSHDYIERAHGERIYSVDKPVTALIQDLKTRGLLDETLIVWTGEFGRTPDNQLRGGGVAVGRDHNADAMVIMMAGGGVKAGHSIGATDEIGNEAVEVVHPMKDFHITLLRLLGLDDNKLTYFHGGRFKQLSQTGGEVIKELIA